MDAATPDHLAALAIGQTASYTRTVTEADIVLFAGVSGDDNPVHLDEVFAAASRYRGRIAHGMLSASYISTVIGTRLPGPGTVYLDQTLSFRAPVRAGDTVTARVTVIEVDEARRRVTLDTVCRVGETRVIEGRARVMLPRREG